MTQFLSFLKGKKTTIAAVIGLLITFAATRGYIAGDVAELLASIMVAVGLSANYATTKLVK
jgi:hypothetical protein